ncbi:MAG: hypothetical protein M3258_06785 [Thermoproteota archaeon]|nr:hypothetical protein [Thermoproteota archaeon]
MIAKSVGAILAATLVSLSVSAGSFYFVGAQDELDEEATGQAAITLSNVKVSPRSTVTINGNNFGANSQVSIYFMSARHVNLSNGSALVLQGITANHSSAIGQERNDNYFGENAPKMLEDLLQSNNLIVTLPGDAPSNGRVNLQCDHKNLARGSINGNIVALSVAPAAYNGCSISISDGNITDSGAIGNLVVVSNSEEEFRNSAVASTTSNEQGVFETTVRVPNVKEGEYAILAVGNNRIASASELSVSNPQSDREAENNDAGAVANTTIADITNETNTQTPEENVIPMQNQTQSNQNVTNTGGIVQLDETRPEPGSPLTIRGEGFRPETPIQILINNIQVASVITNVEGSFTTVVIVPINVNAGNAKVVVRTEQTSIVENVNILQAEGVSERPSTLRLTAVSPTENGNRQALTGAPVTIFDAISGQVIESGRTPMEIQIPEGTYYIFYSNFDRFDFGSAQIGKWIDTPDGGSGLITIREGRNTILTAKYNERPMPPPPRETENSLTLRAQDNGGSLIPNMFAAIYNADNGEKIEQGFTELRVDRLRPGTYPIFFANFKEFLFLTASAGTWVQTPFGGMGLVTIPDDGEDHNIVVTSLYNRSTAEQEQFNVRAPLDLHGQIFTTTSNQTRPEGPFVISGSFALSVRDEEPVSANLSAYLISAREDSNKNVDLKSQWSREYGTLQIVDLKPQLARPVGPNSYVISGTADLLINGNMYFNDEKMLITVNGGKHLTPTNIEIDFHGEEGYSAANRVETLYGVVSSGFQ